MDFGEPWTGLLVWSTDYVKPWTGLLVRSKRVRFWFLCGLNHEPDTGYPEPRTGPSVWFFPGHEHWTKPQSGSGGFRFEPWFWTGCYCCEYVNIFFFSHLFKSITFLISFCLPLFRLYYLETMDTFPTFPTSNTLPKNPYLMKGTLGTCSKHIRNFPCLASHV